MIFIIRGGFRRKILYLVLLIGFYLLTPYLHKDDGLRVTFLDVGQGESSVIEFPKGEVMLIDGGKAEPDMGRMVVAPYLWSKGIKRIRYLVLSHPHPDHYGGLMYIIDNFKVDEIWLNGRKTEEAEKFFTKIVERKVPYRILKRGNLLESRDYRIYVLHPYDVFYAGSLRGDFSNQNNDSLVLKIQYNDISVLFTGDIETEAEENLIHLGKWLRSDIIKVPHHGGRTSSTEEFLQMVRPKVAVISVGRNNPFNHPHIETIRRYKDVGAQVFRTDRDGAITLLSVQDDTDSYKIRTYWDTRFREVKALRDEIRNVGLLFR
jgi:competence protein ComEC